MVLRAKNGSILLTLDDHILDDSYKAVAHNHHSLELSCVVDGSGSYRIND